MGEPRPTASAPELPASAVNSRHSGWISTANPGAMPPRYHQQRSFCFEFALVAAIPTIALFVTCWSQNSARAKAEAHHGANDLVDVLAATPSLSRMSSRVVAASAGLSELLTGAQSATVFALHIDALDAVESIVAGLSPTGVQNMLLAHVAYDAELTSSGLFDGMEIKTGGGTSTLYARKDGSNLKIENADGTSSANVIAADMVASNGFVRVLDAVIMPPLTPVAVEKRIRLSKQTRPNRNHHGAKKQSFGKRRAGGSWNGSRWSTPSLRLLSSLELPSPLLQVQVEETQLPP